MSIDATIKTLDEQNALLEEIRMSSSRLKSIDTRLMNQHLRDKQSKLADKEDSSKRDKILSELAGSIKGGGAGGGSGVAAGGGSGGGSGGGGGGLGGLLGKGALMAGVAGVLGGLVAVLGSKSPLGEAVKQLKKSKIGRWVVRMFHRIKNFFGKKGPMSKVRGFFGKGGGMGKIGKRISGALGKIGRVFTRLFAVVTAILAVFSAHKVFEETEGTFTDKISAALREFGITVLDAIFGWIPTLAGHILEFFGAPEWLTTALKEFDFKKELTLFIDTLSIMLEDALLFFLDGSFVKVFTEDIPNGIGKLFKWIKDKVYDNVVKPIMEWAENSEAIQTAIVGGKVLINIIKAIPTFIENFVTNMINSVRGILRGLINMMDKIKIPAIRAFGKEISGEIKLGSKVIPSSLREFADAPDQKTKEIDIYEGVSIQKVLDARAGAAANSSGGAGSVTTPVVVQNVTNNNTVSAPTTNTSIAARTEAVEKTARRRNAQMYNYVPSAN